MSTEAVRQRSDALLAEMGESGYDVGMPAPSRSAS
jgi:hypothetical protein